MARQTIKPINQIRDALAQLPEQSKEAQVASLFDAVKLLADDIRALLQKGYSYQQIADILAVHGVGIAGRTLRNYMARLADGGHTKRNRGMSAGPGEIASVASDKNSRRPGASSGKFTPSPDVEEI